MISGFILFSCKNSGNKENSQVQDSSAVESKKSGESEYTCPMHPEVVRKEAGTCPQCGMELQIRSWGVNRIQLIEIRLRNVGINLIERLKKNGK